MRGKKTAIKLLISTIIILFAIITDYFVQDYIYKNKCEIVEDDFSHMFQIDNIEQKDKKLVLTGWVFELGVDSVVNDFDIVLHDYSNDKKYYMDVVDVVREDVNEYFLCEYDYSDSGFVASLKLDMVDLDSINYEVLIRPKDVQQAYKSGVYISKSKMMYTEPKSIVNLDVEGTDLEQIVDAGVLRVYRPDVGIYVYQYEEMLYWIADESYEFEEDGKTYMQCQINTTQINELPQQRLEKGSSTDNISFYFEKRELLEIDSEKYRVSVIAVPKEYAITKILIGYYVNGWKWHQDFRPWYEYK